MATYRVKKGHTVHHGVGGKIRKLEEGDTLELTEEEAKKMPWAVEPAAPAESKKPTRS